MTRRFITIIFVSGLLGAMTGCTGQMVQTAAGPMPDYCTTGASNMAGGAVIGSLLGAAIGAAAGGGRGAALGAAIGGAAGTLTGAQMDANCRQVAMQNFMQMMAQQAAAQQAALAAGQQPQLVSFDWDAPSPVQGQPPVHHRIAQTNNYTDSALNEQCGNYAITDFANQASAVTGTGKVCIGAGGVAHSA